MSDLATRATTGVDGLPAGAAVVDGVSKVYELGGGKLRVRDAIPFLDARPRRPLVALDDIHLRIEPGESVGLIGPNGAGKSTLLKVIAGVTDPTSGSIRRGGRVGSMIDLGLGFHPDMSGWENIRCSGRVLGHSSETIRAAEQEIARFSGIEDALDSPLKTYSTGMRARLGFAVATQLPADLLVIDEVLAVGDREFQERCLDRMDELVAGGTTVVFVSHDMALVTRACSRAVQLRAGRLVDSGRAFDVVERYLSASSQRLRLEVDDRLRFVDFRLDATEIRPWDPIAFETEVLVSEPVGRVRLGVDLIAPTHTPDRPFASADLELAALSEPGRYRIVGRTSDFPGEGGLLRFEASLIDGEGYRRTDRVTIDIDVLGTATSNKPHLAVIPGWSITPIDAPELDAPPSVAFGADSEVVATLEAVTKRFPSGSERLRLMVPGPWGRRMSGGVLAIDDLSLSLARGSCTGIIGPNGAGKSTLLRLLASIARPDRGRVHTVGRVVPVLDLQMGFHPELTGDQNVSVSARLLGQDADEIARVRDDIVEFAGLAEVMDVPVSRYSMGMRARLGFALAIHSNPDILLVDELLAVGDEEFRRRAIDAMHRRREAGAAIAFVSHELRLVEEICDHVIRLDAGRLIDAGPPDEVVERYGGQSWSSAVNDASASIRFHGLRVRHRHVLVDEPIEFEGRVEVDQPVPAGRIELSYRVAPESRAQAEDPIAVKDRSFFVRTVEPAAGALATKGWYEFSGSVDRNAVEGRFDLVVSAVDGRDNVTISEAWQPIAVGDRVQGFPGPALRLSAEVERLGD